MKLFILKIVLVIIYYFSSVKPNELNSAYEKKNIKNLIKDTRNKTIDNEKKEKINNVFIVTETQENNNNSEHFNFDNIILNLSIIENKIKSFKKKLESKIIYLL